MNNLIARFQLLDLYKGENNDKNLKMLLRRLNNVWKYLARANKSSIKTAQRNDWGKKFKDFSGERKGCLWHNIFQYWLDNGVTWMPGSNPQKFDIIGLQHRLGYREAHYSPSPSRSALPLCEVSSNLCLGSSPLNLTQSGNTGWLRAG